MAEGYGLTTIVACLKSGNEYCGIKERAVYQGNEDPRQERLAALMQSGLALRQIGDMKIAALACPTAEEINAFMASVGSSIRLQPWAPGPGRFGMAGHLDLSVLWRNPGEQFEEEVLGKKRAVFLMDDDTGAAVLNASGYDHPVVMLPTQNGYDAFMTVCRKAIPSEHVFGEAMRLASAARGARVHHDYEGAIIPCVSLDFMPDISWMVDFCVEGGTAGYSIAAAKQQIRFYMNHKGARVLEDTAMEATLGGSFRQPYFLNDEFLLVIHKKGEPMPVVMLRVMEPDMKDPGDIVG